MTTRPLSSPIREADTTGFDSSRPLSGIRVLDLGRVLAGPFCGMLLADLGAEVIKIEPPQGDDSRYFGPYTGEKSAYCRLFNRWKFGITLNLKDPEDVVRFKALIERSDVLIENFRPGVLARLGIPVETMLKLNPRLVVVSITGFGQTGPLRMHPAYDLIVQAMSGLMAATGFPTTGPTRSAVSLGDIIPGLYGALGTMAALFERTRTGRGQHVNVAMFDALIASLESVAMRALYTDDPIERLGNDHALSAPYSTYDTDDGPIAVAIANEPLFERFAETMGHHEWLSDPRFANDSARAANRESLRREIENALGKLTREDVLGRLESAGVPTSPVLEVREALSHPQARAQEMIIEEEDGFRTLGTPLKFSGSIMKAPRPAPNLGEHNALMDRWIAEPTRTGEVGST